MKIVIATGIYPPEVGGPSYYAQGLAEALRAAGHDAPVVTYGMLKKLPTGIRHLAYMGKLLPRLIGADAVIALDTFSVALPVVLLARLFRVPVIIRVGGDFLWELYVERTKDLVPLPRMYEQKERWNWKERLIFALSRWVVRQARVVFSSPWLLEIWKDAYHLDLVHTHVIENAIQAPYSPVAPKRKNFLFFARQITLKNNAAFRRAFAQAQRRNPDIELEEGVVPHAELLERMRSCYAIVVPSLSEVSPNAVIDAIRCGKPFLLTKYSGYAERFAQYGVLVDPLSEDDMARGIAELADSATYAALSDRISRFNEQHSYDDIAREFVTLVGTFSAPLR